MLPEDAVAAVRTVVSLLTQGAFQELESLTEGRRLSAPEMADAIGRYGRDLATPPADAFARIAPVELATGEDRERAYHVDFLLWTVQDGRSDLELRLTLVEVMAQVWTVEVVSIRPLEGF